MADEPQMVQVRVTHIIDPHNFHAQIIGSEESFEQLESQAARLDELGRAQAEDPAAVGVSPDHCPGDWVLAFSTTWNKWVRARLNLVNDENGEVDVNCVDYGTIESVRVEHILSEVDDRVTEGPPQAYPCTLAGVKPIASVWISRATNHFGDLVLGTTVTGQVICCDPQNLIVLDLLIEDELGHICSASELLFKEGLGKLVPVQPSGELGKVPDFDINRLHARPAPTGGDGQEEEGDGEPDIEVNVFRSLMGADEDTPKWRPTDASIGHDYKPNVDPDSLQTLQDDLRQLKAGQGASISVGRDNSWERHRAKGKARNRARDRRERDRPRDGCSPQDSDKDQDKEKNEQSTQDSGDRTKDMRVPLNRPGHRDKWAQGRDRRRQEGVEAGRGRGGGRGRGLNHREKDPKPPMNRARRSPRDPLLSQTTPALTETGHPDKPPTPPAYPESAPPAKPSPHKLKATRGSEKEQHHRDLTPDSSGGEGGVQSESRPARARRYGPLSNKKQQNEYEWQRSKVERRAKQILKNLSADTVPTVTAELKDLIHPEVSGLCGLPGPKELYVCMEQVVLHALTRPEQLDAAVSLLQQLTDEDDFVSVMSPVLPDILSEYVKVTTNVVTQRQRRPLVRLVARLYRASHTWTAAAREPITVCVTNSFDKWCEFNIKKQHPAPGALYEVYTDCLSVLLEEAGHDLEEHWPAKVKSGFDHLQLKALDPQIPESLRLQILDLLVQRKAGWPRLKQSNSSSSLVRSPSENRGIQVTTHELLSQADQCTETEIPVRDSMATQTWPTPVASDPYQRVTCMLQDLHMGELLDTFIDNAIRDSALELPFTDLRQLLREVEVKPGYVWEIKTYLENHKNTQQWRLSSVRSASPSSSSSYYDLTTPEQISDSERPPDPPADRRGPPADRATLGDLPLFAPHHFHLLTPSTFTTTPPPGELLARPRPNSHTGHLTDTQPASRPDLDPTWRGAPSEGTEWGNSQGQDTADRDQRHQRTNRDTETQSYCLY